MSKRFYLCPIIGDGKELSSAFRPKIDNYCKRWTSIPNPSNTWAICIAGMADHSAPLADPEIIALPDKAYDSELTSLDLADQTKLKQKLRDFGISDTFTAGAKFSDLIDRFGKTFEPYFTIDKMLRCGDDP
jgi:hypothetical protein